MFEREEIESKVRLEKKGYIYTWNGDSPGVAATLEEVGEGRLILGEIGKTSIEEMAEKLLKARS